MSHRSANKTLHLIGFGSQARAWAQCLRASGWHTPIYLSRPQGRSAEAAQALGFDSPSPLSALADQVRQSDSAAPALVAFLCPDPQIAPVYRDYLASLDAPLTLVLAHGYAVYAGELRTARPGHELALLAPKAIGPKIWQLYQDAKGRTHRLVAAFGASEARAPQLRELARAMGFAEDNLVPASFEQEAAGDLISEQGLLCGGLFTLLEWTLEAMQQAGIPPRLIREECLTELELVAGLLRERGPASTFAAISQAAQAGTVEMQGALEASGARSEFDRRLQQVLSGEFADRFRSGRWKPQAERLQARLERWQRELQPSTPISQEQPQ